MAKWETKEKRMNDIVNAAVAVFLDKGYEGASMESIAKQAQISKGGLYHHFGSKDEILFYASEKLNEPIYEYVHLALKESDPVAGLQFYIRNYVSYWLSHQKELTFFFLTMIKAIATPEMWKAYADYYTHISDFIKALYDRGISNGQFVEHNTRASALTLMSALDGVLSYLVMSENIDLDAVIGDFEAQFINSVLISRI